MKFRAFQHEYHESDLVGFQLVAPRELVLEVELQPLWNSEGSSARVRFSGIENYDEVASFFKAIPRPTEGPIAEIVGLKYLREGPNWVVVDLTKFGDITIQAKRVTEL